MAILVNGDKAWIATNICENAQGVCPREQHGYTTGRGYRLCREVCRQGNHAEVEVCKRAGNKARDVGGGEKLEVKKGLTSLGETAKMIGVVDNLISILGYPKWVWAVSLKGYAHHASPDLVVAYLFLGRSSG